MKSADRTNPVMLAIKSRAAMRAERQSKLISNIVQGFFFLFMCFVLFDGLPFQKRIITEFVLVNANSSGEGDSTRQIFYIALFMLTTGAAFSFFSIRYITRYPVEILAFVVLCLISVAGSVNPGIAFRRTVLSFIFISITINFILVVGLRKTYTTLKASLIFATVISVIGVFVIPEYARHPSNELDPALIGAWKGAYVHKNIAAMMTSIAFIVFFYDFLLSRRVIYAALMLVSLGFLFGTGGKSALPLIAPAIMGGLMYLYFYPKRHGSQAIFVLMVGAASLICGVGLIESERVIAFLQDPLSLTGRVAIWKSVILYAFERPITGSGFGAFWQIGKESPINKITSQTWLLGVLHSHNGYLEMLVTTGFPGLVLSVAATIIIPLKRLFSMSEYAVLESAQVLSLLIFCITMNLVETQLFARDKQLWMIYLTVIMFCKIMRDVDAQNILIKKPGSRR